MGRCMGIGTRIDNFKCRLAKTLFCFSAVFRFCQRKERMEINFLIFSFLQFFLKPERKSKKYGRLKNKNHFKPHPYIHIFLHLYLAKNSSIGRLYPFNSSFYSRKFYYQFPSKCSPTSPTRNIAWLYGYFC